MMRRLAVALVAMLSLPAVAAEAEVHVEARIIPDLDLANPEIRRDLRNEAEEAGCADVQVTIQPEFGTYRIQEGARESGCVQVLFPLTVPPGATHIHVGFDMDRTIQDLNNAQGRTPNAVQDLVVRDAQGEVFTRFTIFAADAPESPQARHFDQAIPANGLKELQVGWHVEDLGIGAQHLPSGQSVQSTIHAIEVYFTGIELTSQRIEASHHLTGDVQESNIEWTAQVSHDMFAAGTPQLLFTYDRAMEVQGLRVPDGEIVPGETLAATLEAVASLEVPADVIAEHGPGTYALITTARTAVVADAALAPMAGTAIFLPMIGAAFAMYQYGQAQRHAHENQRKTNGSYRATLIAIGAVYGIVTLFLFTSSEYWNLLVTPLPAAGIGYFLLFVGIALAFVVAAVVGARQQALAIEQEVDELREVKDALEKSNHDLEYFAYIASHDLQEPLRTISGFSQLLERRYGDQLDDNARRYIQKTVQGSQRMQMLIGDLLAYSRVHTHGRDLTVVDLGQVVDEEKEAMSTRIKEVGATIERTALPSIPADGAQMRQLFSNLMRNAIKYRHPDRPPRVRLDATLEGRYWHFRVRDNGAGIPKEQFDRIFVIFQRLAPRSDQSGTGLGLAICQRIVERHGGRIWVESTVGQGSDFHFLLPAGVSQ